ncbi:MAG: hypothetical protein ABI461_20285, partial [Polyangiaceae bacterium]
MKKRRVGAMAPIAALATLLFLEGFAVASPLDSPDPPPAASGSAAATTTDSPEATKASLNVHAAPIFGSEVSLGSGWGEVVASIENVGGATRHGTISLRSALPWGAGQSLTTRAP